MDPTPTHTSVDSQPWSVDVCLVHHARQSLVSGDTWTPNTGQLFPTFTTVLVHKENIGDHTLNMQTSACIFEFNLLSLDACYQVYRASVQLLRRVEIFHQGVEREENSISNCVVGVFGEKGLGKHMYSACQLCFQWGKWIYVGKVQ